MDLRLMIAVLPSVLTLGCLHSISGYPVSKADAAAMDLRLMVAVLLSVLMLCCLHSSSGHPVSNADAVVENMRQIPQWHCLRYRKFDLVKRCRNYRVMMRRQ